MIRPILAARLQQVVDALRSEGLIPEAEYAPVEIIDTKSPEHGDFACNFAMIAAKSAQKSPRELAELIQNRLQNTPEIEAVEVAGPGFLNLKLRPSFVSGFVATVHQLGASGLARAQTSQPQKINVEFVSVNPNGPITVGSGRGAAFGDTLCRVLAAAGHTVHREYYINDGVNSEQMRLFAASVQSYVEELPFPEKGYRGDYVQEVAAQVREIENRPSNADLNWYQSMSQDLMIERQRHDLQMFEVRFDTWFSEQSLHDSGIVDQRLAELAKKGAADTDPHRVMVKFAKGGKIQEVTVQDQQAAAKTEAEEGPGEGDEETLWLRSTKFGDDMDRVLRRRDGRLTYISSDVAYHQDKFNRPENADHLITVLGPDHHGYIGRLHAVLAALKLEESTQETSGELDEHESKIYRSAAERDACRIALEQAQKALNVVIFQIVRFVKDGQPAPMRKRDGNIYSLRDLILEIGKSAAPESSESEQIRIGRDVARYFYLMRSHETHMDFDIDLATKQSDENPVFYVQYAHARIASVLSKADEVGLHADPSQSHLLTDNRELALIRKIVELPEEIARCAHDLGVHRLTTWAQDLARTYHHFYDGCRVIQTDQPELSAARLALCEATQMGLQGVFGLLGISAPERM
ncbi:MAG TPA: arginine--tRNA ligase [Fimbriimonadaceae bacterium]|nr:arginine--tRNA ligase [Fimbriimonadaceae bacterium]HRJ32549.1 arginine--tRNA ligase [Fimbriimonadaceae bacterium]